MSDIARRKSDHLDLAIAGDVGFRRTTSLFECIRLVHNALPELRFADITLTTTVLGKPLRAPLLIAGMTGGTERAGHINQELAAVAEHRGLAFGLGSQRPMLLDATVARTFQVRGVAPTALLLGNIGVVQATQASRQQLVDLVAGVDADALCVHLNPAMELIQTDGDRDFRGCLERLGELASDFPVPIVAKETGCGLSAQVAKRLREHGVRHADVSGAGGTSWVALEAQRNPPPQSALGEQFSEWGIPTAASVALVSAQGFETVFATGGVSSGLEVAKAIALGATAAGIARPVLQALESGGPRRVHELFDTVERELRVAMFLVGAADLAALGRVPRVLTGDLEAFIEQASEATP